MLTERSSITRQAGDGHLDICTRAVGVGGDDHCAADCGVVAVGQLGQVSTPCRVLGDDWSIGGPGGGRERGQEAEGGIQGAHRRRGKFMGRSECLWFEVLGVAARSGMRR